MSTPDATVRLPDGWAVRGTRAGSQTNSIGNIVQGYTFVVELPSTTQFQVFVPGALITNTSAVRDAIVREGAAIMAVEGM